MARQAVLLVAHGTPESVEQIPDYLRHVTGGRPLPEKAVEEIRHRYELIGHSPLTEITLRQAHLVEECLSAQGIQVPVYVGMRNWHPFIADTVRQMRSDQVKEVTVICMAPQNSRTSVGLYRRAVEAEADPLRVDFTESWARHPLLVEAFAERLRPALASLTAEAGEPVPVLFTAHSVPSSSVLSTESSSPDPYPNEARRTAALVAERVPQITQWWFAFQSQGVSGGAWLGPTVEQTLDKIAAAGIRHLILQPIGFLCDHIEILYDVDIHFRNYAAKLGIRLERPQSLNDSPKLAAAIANLALRGLERLQG